MRLRVLCALLALAVFAASAPAAPRGVLSVGVVFICGPENSMYNSSRDGISRALTDLRVRIEQGFCDFEPERFAPVLEEAARRNDLVIAVGEGLNAAVCAAAEAYPGTDFVLLDSKAASPAVSSALFRQNEPAYLAGALAARLIADRALADPRAPMVCGVILGERGAEFPIMLDFLTGYEQGVHDTDRRVQILRAAVGSWNDPERAHRLAAEMRRRGAQVIFQVAGWSDMGVIQAAIENFFLIIGTDAAQERFAPGIVLTSVLKNYDAAIYDVISLKYAGHLERGSTHFYGLNGRGAGLSWTTVSIVPDPIRAMLEGLTYRICDGEISVASCYGPDGTFRRGLRPLPANGRVFRAPPPPPPPRGK